LSGFTANTTPLTEGITPEPLDLTITSVTGTVEEYGSYIRYTKTLAQMGIHKIAAEASNALGEQAGDSMDLLTRAVLVAETTNVQFANGRADSDSIAEGDFLTFTEIMQAVTTLKSNKAVAPSAGKFPAIIHPKGVYDLFADPLMQAVLNYAKERGDTNPLIRGYLGEAFGVSFWESPNGYHTPNSTPVEVYSTMVLGKGAFGVGGLASYMPQIVKEQMDKSSHTFETVRPLRLIDKPFGSSGTADPFDRLASIAWYTTFVAQVLDESFYVRIEHDTAIT